MTVSPLKSRNYRGDLALEAKFFKAITGEEMTQEKLDLAAERIFYVASRLHGKTDANQRYA
ncbi:putative aldehyde ferredoxin oxidoreductase [Escherichia coli]|uniref:Putative aldehyde ferredoxin oxidoreductase n=1 Tax=Escherichia coli TaxID=562 RepID=A0A376J6T2_ECOLX|nr:putative aldehyde ferredoxin oxidoreductase [Escherichia coli]